MLRTIRIEASFRGIVPIVALGIIAVVPTDIDAVWTRLVAVINAPRRIRRRRVAGWQRSSSATWLISATRPRCSPNPGLWPPWKAQRSTLPARRPRRGNRRTGAVRQRSHPQCHCVPHRAGATPPITKRHLTTGAVSLRTASAAYRDPRKIATLFLRSQAATVDAWQDSGASRPDPIRHR